MKNKPKPDDRSDNVEKIQCNIDHTIANFRRDEERIEGTDDAELKQQLSAKNERRKKSLEGLRSEIQQEATDRENGYQE